MKLPKRLFLCLGAGSLAGIVVWAYDYDFFLNAGGPATPITNTVLRLSHLRGVGFSVTLLWPLVVLIGLGTIVAAVLSRFVPTKHY